MKRSFLFFFVLITVLLLTACNNRVPTKDDVEGAVQQTVVSHNATATEHARMFPTATMTNTAVPPTNTATATPTLTATATMTCTPSPSPTETPTETPIPTEVTAAWYPPGNLIWPRAHFGPQHISWRTSYCAEEGKNLSCETEYRKDNQNCYVGMTCYDACGWYYSVNTIPPGVEEFSGPCW